MILTATKHRSSTSYAATILATSGLVAFWELADSSGTTSPLDSGPNGLSSSVNGTVTFGASGQGGKTSATFDGTSGFIGVPNNSTINSLTAYTMEAWAYATAANDGAGIFSEIFSSNTLMMEMGFDNSPSHAGSSDLPFCGYYNGHSAGWYSAFSSSTLVQNAWQYFVGTYDGSNLNIYCNAVLVGGPVSVSSFPGSNHAGYVLGRRHDTGASPYFAGSLQYVAIYNRALTGTEVSAHYAAI